MFKDKLTPGRITLIYAILAIVWILFSDWVVVALIGSPDVRARLQTFKGIFYVFVTSLLLYWLMRQSLSTVERSRRALERTAQRLKNLHALDRSILESHSPDDMAQNALRRLRALVPADRCSIVLFDHENGEAEVLSVDAAESSTGPPAGTRFDLEHFSVSHVSKSQAIREPLTYIRDIATYSSPSPAVQQLKRADVRSVVSILLRTADDVLGELNLAAKEPAAFTPEHRETAQEIADQLAIGIRQRRLYEEGQRRAAQLETLYTIHRAAAESLDIEATLEAILNTVLEEFSIDIAGVYLLDDDQTRLVLRAHRGASQEFVQAVRSLRVGKAVSGQAITRRMPIVTRLEEYPATEIRPVLVQEGITTVASIPLLSGGEPLGTLTMAIRDRRSFPTRDLKLLSALGQHLGQAIENGQLYEAEQRQRRELNSLYDLSRQLIATSELRTVLDVVIQYTLDAAQGSFCRISLFEEDHLICRAARSSESGEMERYVDMVEPATIHDYYNRADAASAPVFVYRHSASLPDATRRVLFANDAFILCVTPLRAGDIKVGVLLFGIPEQAEHDTFIRTHRRIIAGIADQAAGALYRAKLHSDLESSYIETVLALSGAMDARDTYTADHSKNLARWAVATAEKLGCSAETINSIRWGALLHDIGKIGVPDRILQKSGSLTEEEWEIMQRHPDIGADIVAPVKKMADVAPLIRAHQEKYDGTGYPHGLKGEEIPLGARILAVVDAYSAITDKRPYKNAQSHDHAVAELKRCAGSHFDPHVVDAFLQVLAAG